MSLFGHGAPVVRKIMKIRFTFGTRWVVGLKISGDRCHFGAFQLELDTLDTKNVEIGSVGTKLQPLEVE